MAEGLNALYVGGLPPIVVEPPPGGDIKPTPTSLSFPGSIDNVFVFGKTLNLEEIASIRDYGFAALAGSIPVTQWQITSIADLLEFFDANVASGALMGFGPARSVKGRLKEFRHMLVTAGKLYDKGNLEGGRQKLLAAGARTDGFPQPPDFMAGEASGDLSRYIEQLAELWESQ